MSEGNHTLPSPNATSSSYFELDAPQIVEENSATDPNNVSASQNFQSEGSQLQNENQPDLPIADLMRDIGQQLKLVQADWSKSFSESENFEEFCPQRCEKLVKEAILLEDNLRKHKENVRQRLSFLQTTLQTS